MESEMIDELETQADVLTQVVGVEDMHGENVDDSVMKEDAEGERVLETVGEVDEQGLELLVLGFEVATGVSVKEGEGDVESEMIGELEAHAEVLMQVVGVEERHCEKEDDGVVEEDTEGD